MVEQYQNELLALAAIIILLLIYLTIKRKTSPTKKAIDEIVKETTIQNDTTTEEPQHKESVSEPLTAKKVQKNTPPKHGKINKEDFKIFSGQRILVAEDNIINQKVLLGVLGDSNMEIVIANDGQEALDILENDTNFMLILMDAHMPRVDGFEATKIIRQNPKYDHIPVVALSGDTASDDIKKMKNAGMQDHLEKPLKVDALYDILYQYSNIPQSKTPNKEVSTSLNTLDSDRGLQICGGDVSFYHDILKEFLSTYSNSAQELEVLLKNDKKTQASQLLFDIMGVASNIGADALTASANNIKNNIDKGTSIDLTDYTKNLQELIQAINDYL